MLKNKKFIKAAAVIVAAVIFGCIANKQDLPEKDTSAVSVETQFSYSNWGKALKKLESENQKKRLAPDTNETDIIFQGNSETAVVTKLEYERCVSFYKIAGLDQSEAETAASEECKKTAALYAEAKRRGISVDDGEVRDYVYNELKPFIISADNGDEIQQILSGFGSEKEYWEFMCEIYKKLLPIQKLAEQLRQEYFEKNRDSIRVYELNKSFNEYYEQFQNQLVSKEEFH